MGSAAGWWAERYMRGDCCRLSLVVSGAEQERKGNPWGSKQPCQQEVAQGPLLHLCNFASVQSPPQPLGEEERALLFSITSFKILLSLAPCTLPIRMGASPSGNQGSRIVGHSSGSRRQIKVSTAACLILARGPPNRASGVLMLQLQTPAVQQAGCGVHIGPALGFCDLNSLLLLSLPGDHSNQALLGGGQRPGLRSEV